MLKMKLIRSEDVSFDSDAERSRSRISCWSANEINVDELSDKDDNGRDLGELLVSAVPTVTYTDLWAGEIGVELSVPITQDGEKIMNFAKFVLDRYQARQLAGRLVELADQIANGEIGPGGLPTTHEVFGLIGNSD
jgi:hypothetical protein